nr:hypothetical protein CFP56_20450 [Quercus suber]
MTRVKLVHDTVLRRKNHIPIVASHRSVAAGYIVPLIGNAAIIRSANGCLVGSEFQSRLFEEARFSKEIELQLGMALDRWLKDDFLRYHFLEDVGGGILENSLHDAHVLMVQKAYAPVDLHLLRRQPFSSMIKEFRLLVFVSLRRQSCMVRVKCNCYSAAARKRLLVLRCTVRASK